LRIDPGEGFPVCHRMDYFFQGFQFFLPAKNFASKQLAIDKPVLAQDVIAKTFQKPLFLGFNGVVPQLINVKNMDMVLFQNGSHVVFSRTVVSGKANNFFFIHCLFPVASYF